MSERRRATVLEGPVDGAHGAHPLLDVDGLYVHFPVAREERNGPRKVVQAVDGVSFSVSGGDTLGIVGESGSGKTTTILAIFQLLRPTGGRIRFDGLELTDASKRELRRARGEMQMIYQNPYSSLDPRMAVNDLVMEPLRVQKVGDKASRNRAVAEMLERVGLTVSDRRRFPHEFSGGQRQRIAIARALVLKPKLLLLDEPVSALDVSVQAQILNLLKDLQDDLGLTYVLVSHDLSVVEHIADELLVMHLGKVVEDGPAQTVFSRPGHPYTRALVSAIPGQARSTGTSRIVLEGDPPSPMNPPSGCRFRTRCWLAEDLCEEQEPELNTGRNGPQRAACHFSEAV